MPLALKYAIRQLAKSPQFTTLAVLMLGFGIAMSTTAFGVAIPLIHMNKSGAVIVALSVYGSILTVVVLKRAGTPAETANGPFVRSAKMSSHVPVGEHHIGPTPVAGPAVANNLAPNVRSAIEDIRDSFTRNPGVASADMLNAQYTRTYAEKRYAPLVAKLAGKLTPKQLKDLMAILTNEIADKSDAQRLSLNYKVKPGAALAEADKHANDALANEFGPEIAEETREFEQTLGERAMLNDLNASLVYAGSPLSADQIDTLASALQKAHVSLTGDDPSRLTVAEIDRYMAARAAGLATVLSTAGASLNQTQLDALKQQFEHEALYYQTRRARAAEREAAPVATH